MSDDSPKANTADHEKLISEQSKSMIPSILSLAAAQFSEVIDRVGDGKDDPLQLERYIHNGEHLIQIAMQLWDLGQSAYDRAVALYTQQKGDE